MSLRIENGVKRLEKEDKSQRMSKDDGWSVDVDGKQRWEKERKRERKTR